MYEIIAADPTAAMIDAAVESVWSTGKPVPYLQQHLCSHGTGDGRPERVSTKNFHESLYQRCRLTALTFEQLREYLATLLHALRSSLETPGYSHHKTGSRSFIAISYGEFDEYEGPLGSG